MASWDQKLVKWLTILMALTFIVVGAGILAGWLFATSSISKNMRLLFGSLIFVYGTVRMVVIYIKAKRKKGVEGEQIDDEAKI